MTVSEQTIVRAQEMWPQRDARDPLGVWAVRNAIVGDATGGAITQVFRAPSNRRASFVFTCYSLTAQQLTGTPVATTVQARLLTNWPDADAQVGVQGYSTNIAAVTLPDADFIGQVSIPPTSLIEPNHRFILLFDPRQNPNLGSLDIIEMQWGINVDGNVYNFEGYGYFWDRAVMTTPGGPRHPGSD